MNRNIPEDLIEKVIQSLEKELNFYKDLEQLLLKERNAIVNFDNEELTEINFRKESLLLNIIEIKNHREKIISEICSATAIDNSVINLSFLSDNLPNYSKIFKNFRENFKKTGKKIQSLNEINRHVINSSLNFIKSSLNIIYQNSNRTTYSNYGKITVNQKFTGAALCNNKV